MVSVKAMAFCIGRTGPMSLVRDFFGHEVPPKDGLSLLTQVRRLQHAHIHLNLIKIGVEKFGESDIREISNAIQAMREIYGQVPFGIGRVDYWYVTMAEADGYDTVGDDRDKADQLTHKWTADGAAIDVFLLKDFTGEEWSGHSPVDGPCDKDSKWANGVVIKLSGFSSGESTGRVIGHECGHYLGLRHVDDALNLMYPGSDGKELTSGQAQTMREHCFVWQGC